MSLFNTQRKKVGNATAGETKLPAKESAKKETKAIVPAKAEKKADSKAEKRAAAVQGVVFPKGSAVVKPRVTEKAGRLSEQGVYTFDVQKGAASSEIAKAIEAAYKVEVVKVSVAPVKEKAMFVRGKSGSTKAGKKAYVYLKKGQTIEFI